MIVITVASKLTTVLEIFYTSNYQFTPQIQVKIHLFFAKTAYHYK